MGRKTKPPPKCKAILVCEDVKITKKGVISLINIFDKFLVSDFPIPLNTQQLYLYLTDGVGKYEIRVELVDVATNETLSTSPAIEHDFENRFMPQEVTFRLRCRIPHAGTYEFVAFADDQEIDRLRIEARFKDSS